MQKLIFAVLCTIALTAATVAPSLAAVNCGIINKDLNLGRKPEDIAERMGISVGEVKECKGKTNGTTGAGNAAPAKPETTEQKGAPQYPAGDETK